MSRHNWSKESLNLLVGDQIIWQDAESKSEGGPVCLSSGMKGKVISLYDGAHLDVLEGCSIPARILVEFESGERLLPDHRHKWEKVTKG